jgi:PPOX class probable F420-dependent enzyme
MSVTMSDDEVARFLAECPNATVISINPNGIPLPAPVWFANKGADIFFRTMRKTQKAKNLMRDPRCVVQVEAGTKYVELRAVIVTGTAQEASAEEAAWFEAQMDQKYADLRAGTSKMPDATRKHYDNPRVLFRVVPEKVKTWDNRKLRFKAE